MVIMINTKLKSYEDKANTNFQGKKVPKMYRVNVCDWMIMLGSVIRANKKYYPGKTSKSLKIL